MRMVAPHGLLQPKSAFASIDEANRYWVSLNFLDRDNMSQKFKLTHD